MNRMNDRAQAPGPAAPIARIYSGAAFAKEENRQVQGAHRLQKKINPFPKLQTASPAGYFACSEIGGGNRAAAPVLHSARADQ